MTLHTTHQKTIKKPINSTQSLKLSSFRSAIHFGFKQIFLQRYQPKGSTDSASSSSKSPPKLDMAWSCSPHKSHFAQSFFLELWASWATHMKILELRKLGALWLGFFKECFEVLYGVMIWRCRKQLRGQQTWEKNTVLRLFGLRKESLYVDSILKISGHLIYLTWLEDLYTYVTMCIYFRKRFPASNLSLLEKNLFLRVSTSKTPQKIMRGNGEYFIRTSQVVGTWCGDTAIFIYPVFQVPCE